MRLLRLTSLLILIIGSTVAIGQTENDKQPRLTEAQKRKQAADALASERRTFAVAQLISLADEARSYPDLALRPHVLVRAADALWEADSESARRIFRRAWEAAEIADADAQSTKIEDRQLQMVAAMKRVNGIDSRNEVLRAAARRDHALGEEFLGKLKDKTKQDSGSQTSGSNSSEDLARRLQLARKLLDDDQIDPALAFAAPALNQIDVGSIGFLCALRPKRTAMADEKFGFMVAQAEYDPSSDANTVSLLSSYAFTPGNYLTFKPDGGASWSFAEEKLPSPDLPSGLRAAFFKVAAAVLLRPLPPPDQDYTTSGRMGKYKVINRLMPLFERFAPDIATALRSQLASLATDTPKNRLPDPDRMAPSINDDASTKPAPGDILQKMQNRLDHAKTPKERDSICLEVASELADQGDPRARDVADKIDNSEMRNKVRAYVDFQMVRFAFKKKDAAEAIRLAKAGQITHTQRVWAYVQAARLLGTDERSRTIELLEEGIVEARRIEVSDPDHARALFALATQFVPIDGPRAWEVISEAVRAANAAEKFTGEDSSIRNFPITLKAGGTFESTNDEDFGITNILRSLAKDDLYRCMDVAKGLKKDGPRAAAIIAIAAATLQNSTVSSRQ